MPPAVTHMHAVPNFTDPAVPKVFDDPMIADGTLFLFDPGHSQSGLTAGVVPATGSKVRNLAWQNAARVIGSGDVTSLAGTYTQVGLTGTSGKVERSGKGGLHAIVSKTNMVAGHGADIELPDLVKTFLIANPTATVVVTEVRRITRAASIGAGQLVRHVTLNNTAGVAANYLAQVLQNAQGLASNPPVGDPTYVGRSLVPASGVGAAGGELVDNAVKGFVGTVPATAAAFRAGFYFGDRPINNPTTVLQLMSSSILYRLQVEILTGVAGVTGRSFTDYTAASQAWFSRHVLTAGGRYFGDTYTDPATIA